MQLLVTMRIEALRILTRTRLEGHAHLCFVQIRLALHLSAVMGESTFGGIGAHALLVVFAHSGLAQLMSKAII